MSEDIDLYRLTDAETQFNKWMYELGGMGGGRSPIVLIKLSVRDVSEASCMNIASEGYCDRCIMAADKHHEHPLTYESPRYI